MSASIRPIDYMKSESMSKIWYIQFEHNGKVIKRRLGLNRIHNHRERIKHAKIALNEVNQMLSEGWTPDNKKEIKRLTVSEAFKDVMSSLTLARSSINDYRYISRAFLRWLKSKGYLSLFIRDINKGHIKEYFALLEKKLQGGGLRKHHNHLKAMFSRMVDREYIEVNPIKGVKSYKANPAVNVPLTDTEVEKVKKHLSQVHPRLLLFCEIVYSCGLRPKEVLSLTNKDLHEDRVIVLAENTKTNRQRTTPLPNHIKERLSIDTPETVYLFRTKYRLEPKAYKTPLHRNRVSELWKRYVKEDLKIDKGMYSLRHKSACDHWNRNHNLMALRDFLGHTSVTMTERYMRSMVDLHFEINKQGLIF